MRLSIVEALYVFTSICRPFANVTRAVTSFWFLPPLPSSGGADDVQQLLVRDLAALRGAPLRDARWMRRPPSVMNPVCTCTRPPCFAVV